MSDRAMMKHKPGDANESAYQRSASTSTLSHPNFAHLRRNTETRGRLVRNRAGRKTYAYGGN